MNIMLRLLVTGLIAAASGGLCLKVASSQAGPQQQELAAADHFLFSYLDQWISRINHTMLRMEQEQEGVTASLSNQCFKHMRFLLDSGHRRSPWALKSKSCPLLPLFFCFDFSCMLHALKARVNRQQALPYFGKPLSLSLCASGSSYISLQPISRVPGDSVAKKKQQPLPHSVR